MRASSSRRLGAGAGGGVGDPEGVVAGCLGGAAVYDEHHQRDGGRHDDHQEQRRRAAVVMAAGHGRSRKVSSTSVAVRGEGHAAGHGEQGGEVGDLDVAVDGDGHVVGPDGGGEVPARAADRAEVEGGGRVGLGGGDGGLGVPGHRDGAGAGLRGGAEVVERGLAAATEDDEPEERADDGDEDHDLERGEPARRRPAVAGGRAGSWLEPFHRAGDRDAHGELQSRYQGGHLALHGGVGGGRGRGWCPRRCR